MKTDFIKEIKIDELGRLCIKPENQNFNMIWRSATEVHWDGKEKFLYSPKPREWSYFDWFKQITNVVKDEYNCVLSLNSDTLWINIPETLKIQISTQST